MARRKRVDAVAADAAAAAAAEPSAEGLSVYIGPTIIGVIQGGSIYRGSPEYALANDAALKLAVSRYAAIAGLVVRADGSLTKVRQESKAAGTPMYKARRALRNEVRGPVKPNRGRRR